VEVDPLQALVFYVAFVFSVTLHEAAHAWAALRGGDPTAYLGGQVSLDPRPHMRREPFGMVWLPLISVAISGWPFGYASAPYDPAWARRHPRRAAWMALAGPGANLAIVLAAALAIRVGIGQGVFVPPASLGFGDLVSAPHSPVAAGVGLVLSVFFSLNLVLLVLNLIPVPPLDGYGALGLLLPESTVLRYQDAVAHSGAAWLGILVAWFLFGRVFGPVFWLCIGWLYPEMRYG
jgi:Zn-dependent protease